MPKRKIGLLLTLGAALVLTSVAHADNLFTGSVRVIDGDTLVLGKRHIRLEGIDAPETDQVCLDADRQRWNCGITARENLAAHIAGRPVLCEPQGEDRYGRTLAICSADRQDLNAWMVREGLALAFTRYSREYVDEETAARKEEKGMWIGAFVAPWDWRHRNKNTVILGALVVPITAQVELLTPASSANAPSPDCTIKGNVNRKGEHIYHLPGQLAYSKIDMSDSQKRWFCSEEEARAAGWRPAKR
jgi:endonuclease YncB( thermonuclease family)